MTVSGDWLPRFAPVAAEFARPVGAEGECGALCLMLNGRVVREPSASAGRGAVPGRLAPISGWALTRPIRPAAGG